MADEPEVIHRAQLFPLRLNRAQANYMAKAAGSARFAYNWALAEWKRQAMEWWESGKATPFPAPFALQKQFNSIRREQFPWFDEISYIVAMSSIFSVGQAFDAYKAGQTRYPRFKTRDSRRSFLACASRRETRIIDGRHLTVPRLGLVRLGCKVRWPDAIPFKATISERAGKWYVAIAFAIPVPSTAPTRPSIAAGVDLGISTPLVVTSEGVTISIGSDIAQRLNVERRKLRRANKRLHRRVKGSGRRYRAKQQVARIHSRMMNIRADMQHKATALISGMASRVGIETLAVRNMMRNGRLARSIADVGFFEIRRQLNYKADQVVEADRFYPSSKTCSACGSIKQSLKLSDRIFICEDCGHTSDRDENAARNLERMAAEFVVSARGARSPTRRRKLVLSSLAAKREAKTRATHDE